MDALRAVVLGAAFAAAACGMLSGLDDLAVDGDGIVPGDAAARVPDDASIGFEVDGGGGSPGGDAAGPGSGDAAPGSSPVPVADWPFDEGTGTTARDLSGRAHHATANGGRWTEDRTGASGKAFVLAGGTDHLTAAAHPDFDRPRGAKLTMTLWARVDAAPSHTYLLDVGFGSEGYGIELKSRTVLTYWDGVNHALETTIPDVVGGWHHYGVVVDGAEARVYLDGARVNAGPADSTPRVATEIVFGLDAVEPVYLRGALDRVRFYRAALTDAEILAEKDR